MQVSKPRMEWPVASLVNPQLHDKTCRCNLVNAADSGPNWFTHRPCVLTHHAPSSAYIHRPHPLKVDIACTGMRWETSVLCCRPEVAQGSDSEADISYPLLFNCRLAAPVARSFIVTMLLDLTCDCWRMACRSILCHA